MRIQSLKKALLESRYLVCLLGINTLTDCGCYNYLDLENAYAVEAEYGYSPEEILSASFFGTRTRTFFDFYRNRILKSPGEPLEPLPTIRRMEEEGKALAVITRSIYGIPHRAGIRNHTDLHGSILNNKCTHCGAQYDLNYMREHSGIPLCMHCGAPVRPDIVLDGELIPNSLITAAANEVEKADTLLLLGCTLRSTLARNAIKYFEGSRIILINEEENYSDSIADLAFHGKPRDILPMIYR